MRLRRQYAAKLEHSVSTTKEKLYWHLNALLLEMKWVRKVRNEKSYQGKTILSHFYYQGTWTFPF